MDKASGEAHAGGGGTLMKGVLWISRKENLICSLEDLGWNPTTHVKSRVWLCVLVNPALGNGDR